MDVLAAFGCLLEVFISQPSEASPRCPKHFEDISARNGDIRLALLFSSDRSEPRSLDSIEFGNLLA